MTDSTESRHHGPSPTPSHRPPLTPQMTPDEFARWYWTVAELRPFARALGITSTGTKLELSDRIAARLAGREPKAAPRGRRTRLTPPLTATSVIPEGVVLSRELRNWFTAEIGPQFHVDQHMRDFLRNGAGHTLEDAVGHWYATRELPRPEIAVQFELNRFTRAWRAANPHGSTAELRRAWQNYRNSPTDQRTMLDPK